MSTIDFGPVQLPDGSTLHLQGTITPASAGGGGTTDPGTDGVPRWVKVGAGPWFPLAGVNPSDTRHPGGRDEDELVLYLPPLVRTVTNEFGAEVAFDGTGRVITLYDRQAAKSQIGTLVPSGGGVLSGHGQAREYLLRWSGPRSGSVPTMVTFSTDLQQPGTGTSGGGGQPPAGGGYPVNALSIYKMMYPDSPGFRLATAPAECNVVRLAFATGNPPSLIGFGPEGRDVFMADARAWTAAGKRIVVSYGGEGQPTSTSDRAAFLRGVEAVNSQLDGMFHGWDWDIETGGQTVEDLVYLSKAMKDRFGPGFAISFVPGDIPLYLQAAARLEAAGDLDEYGQQFYEAPVSTDAMMGRLDEAVRAGIKPEHLSVGMMIAPDARHWTNAECVTNFTAARAKYPGITKAYLWEGSRAGTVQWAADMARIAAGR